MYSALKTGKRKKLVKIMKPIEKIKHHVNSLHVYCRLCSIMDKSTAMKIIKLYEKIPIYRLLYKM